MTKFRCISRVISNISTPMPLAGHDQGKDNYKNIEIIISTPMPLAGHDTQHQVSMGIVVDDFYSHAPRGA